MKTRLMEIVQQTKYLTSDAVKQGITCSYVQDYAYIIHDADTREDGTLKEPHWHIYLRLKDSTDSKYIAQAFGVPEQYINRVKGKWVDALMYCTHENAPEKYQYSEDDVTSNFDFHAVKEKEKAKKAKDARLLEIIDGIDTGLIREYNYFEHISMADAIKYDRQIKAAFKYRTDRLRGLNREMDCIFITGEAGTGKTTYAKMLADDKNLSVFVSSGSNDVLDGYCGEDCIILDDLRPSCLGLSDLLKMLDNNTASTVKSRYKNKVLECKLIIITSVLSLDTFFSNVFKDDNEPIVQLKRRCQCYITMHAKTMDVYGYNPTKRDYMHLYTVENPVSFVAQEHTEEEVYNYVGNLLGGAIKGLKKVQDNLQDFKPVTDDEELPFK